MTEREDISDAPSWLPTRPMSRNSASSRAIPAPPRPPLLMQGLFGRSGAAREDAEPDLRWRGNQRQQYRAARTRARKRGHWTSTRYIDYGPIGTTDRFVLSCSCGEKSAHRTEARRIAAEREHVLREGAKR